MASNGKTYVAHFRSIIEITKGVLFQQTISATDGSRTAGLTGGTRTGGRTEGPAEAEDGTATDVTAVDRRREIGATAGPAVSTLRKLKAKASILAKKNQFNIVSLHPIIRLVVHWVACLAAPKGTGKSRYFFPERKKIKLLLMSPARRSPIPWNAAMTGGGGGGRSEKCSFLL